jgi:hypothetical protein
MTGGPVRHLTRGACGGMLRAVPVYHEGGEPMNLLDRAKELFTRRGGAEAAKEDAQEVKDVAQSDASAGDKAKAAGEAIKDPGAPGEPGQAGQAGERPDSPGGPDRPPA